ncbi:type II toxin-antitoxin system VapC family toxin [Gellertiella hungarica]|uniref:Putative nucleic acid-binding protein n=1 Tax=Gellertiella hungarica TaxID=1572859 RepID=A0A7W6NKT8_9HYPH|nr:type II toxin-antitoxin system VapC family toxin [Gellertiella hungarica]MBB4065810.1 putative nucleic acid-binding protein [Gellertiella hungarica]
MRIYLDANIFIRAMEKLDPVASRLEALILAEMPRDGMLVTAEFTLSELLVKPYRDQNAALILQYEDLLTEGGLISLFPLTRPVYRLSAQLRASNRGLKLPDALHLAAAAAAGCSHFLTGDEGIRPSQLEADGLDDFRDLAILRPDLATLDALLKSLDP